MILINTFDLEPWWSTIPPCVPIDDWDNIKERSEAYLFKYLDLCDQASVRCTFFVVGWYAKKFPGRIREIVKRGHDIGCHSLYHEDVAVLETSRFYSTTREAKDIIENVSGAKVDAYRAPSFSFPVNRGREYFQILFDLGFTIDSSVTTAKRIYGGGFDSMKFSKPLSLKELYGVDILEIPVPGVSVFRRELPMFGGGYLRAIPLSVLKYLVSLEHYQVLYIHAHDFDRHTPGIPGGSIISNLRRKINSGDLNIKLLSLYSECKVFSCREFFGVKDEYIKN